jgi:hypothetical protein
LYHERKAARLGGIDGTTRIATSHVCYRTRLGLF